MIFFQSSKYVNQPRYHSVALLNVSSAYTLTREVFAVKDDSV